MSPRWVATIAVLACAIGAPAIAIAQPAADPALEEARAHFAEGVRRYDARDYEGALAEFRAAYAARSSPALLRNVALSLRALGRNAEAIEALERMLAEGTDLAPNVREAANRTLQELRAVTGTVRVHVVLNAPPGTASPRPTVALDGRVLAPERQLEPVWVDPGPHTVTASAPGFTDAAVTVVVKAGDRDVPAEVSLLARAALVGFVKVRANVADARIAVDGVEVGLGAWEGPLPPGHHRVEVSAPKMVAAAREIDVAEQGREELAIDLAAEPTPAPAPEAERRWFVAAGAGLFGGELPIRAGPRPLIAATIGARFGRRFGPYLTAEIDGELQGGGTPELVKDGHTSSFTMTHAAIGAGVRLTSATQPRFTVGGVGGFVNQNITHKTDGAGDNFSGGAPTGFLQVEGGVGVALSPSIDLEVLALVGLLGVNSELLSGTVMGRYGGRAGLVFKF